MEMRLFLMAYISLQSGTQDMLRLQLPFIYIISPVTFSDCTRFCTPSAILMVSPQNRRLDSFKFLLYISQENFNWIMLFLYFLFFCQGPGHADDLGYVFRLNILNYKYIPNVNELHTLRKKMTTLISNFVYNR